MSDAGAAPPNNIGSRFVTAAGVIAPGLVLAGGVAVCAWWLEWFASAQLSIRLPAIVVALLIGMALHGLARGAAFSSGLGFCVKRVLRYSIALLGLRISVADLASIGMANAALVVASMALTVISGVWAARLLGRSADFGALAGGATAVCGASAALAISTVLPPSPQRDADTAFTVLAVNALSTIAMLAYPLVASALHFDARATGVLLGATIHDVAQVAGAGYAVSAQAGNVAVIVKLFRVLLLLPVVLAIAFAFARRGGGTTQARVPLPLFALAFLALMLANSFFGGVAALLPAKGALVEASRWGLLIAIAALGLGTSPAAMVKLGWRHAAVAVIASLVILAVVVAGLLLASAA